MGGESYELRLVALADDDCPPVIRLRQVLKEVLRMYRFHDVSVVDVTPYPDRVEDLEGMPNVQ
jgi:hypothetical protein